MALLAQERNRRDEQGRLVIAAQHLKKLRKRPDAKRLVKIAEQWRPWRSAAALLLWHYRRNMPDWSAKEPKAGKK